MTALTHLDWRPVMLLRVVRPPFAVSGGISLRRCYLALHDTHVLCADWTLEAEERAEALVCAAGWTLTALPDRPMQLHGDGAKRIPSGTWVLPYSDALYARYTGAEAALARLFAQIDARPTTPDTLDALLRLSQLT